MNQKQIDRFFEILSQSIKWPKAKAKIILTGAAAGALMGSQRPSIDIDFAIICSKNFLGRIEQALKKASQITGIAANFSEDIDRWSEITYLDYKKHYIPYKTFGSFKVFILSPSYWSIGKLTRYLDPDVDDLVRVLKHKRTLPVSLAKLWGKALKRSPRSNACFIFRSHAEHFLKTYGQEVWGKHFNPNKCLQTFYKASGIKRSILPK